MKLTSRASLGIHLKNISEPSNLLDILFESGGDDLVVALGCIIAYCSQVYMEQGKERFNEMWQQLKDLEIRFADMDEGAPDAIKEINYVLKPRKYFFIVIGGNRTIAGGKEILIPTDDFIGLIAKKNGFEIKQKISMSVQKSYMIHSKNSINTESILILRKK